MLQKLRERSGSESGFTLVELLVVMLILGILAAIAIPSFFSQREKAQDADAKAAVRTAQTAIETYATDNDSKYTGAKVDGTPGSLQDIEPTLNDVGANLTLPVAATDTTYTVRVESENGHQFDIARADNGVVTLSCTPPSDGGCPSSGFWD